MNACFRVAFRALCLGLGLPLLGFICLELWPRDTTGPATASHSSKLPSVSAVSARFHIVPEAAGALVNDSQLNHPPHPQGARPGMPPDALSLSAGSAEDVTFLRGEQAPRAAVRPYDAARDVLDDDWADEAADVPSSTRDGVARGHFPSPPVRGPLSLPASSANAPARPRPLSGSERHAAPRELHPSEASTADDMLGTGAPSVNLHLAGIQQRLNQLTQFQLTQYQQQQQSDQLQQATQLLQQMQQANQLDQLQRQIESLKAGTAPAVAPNGAPYGSGGNAGANTGPGSAVGPGSQGGPFPPDAFAPFQTIPLPSASAPSAAAPANDGTRRPGDRDRENAPGSKDVPSSGSKGHSDSESTTADGPARPGVLTASPSSEGSDRFSLQIKDADISEVLDMLGQLSGRNLLASRGVTGRVTANLHEVNLQEALSAILKSTGYVFVEEGEFLYVVTPEEAQERERKARQVITKVYRPYYISVKDLRALVTPLLTEGIGKIAVTIPSEVGIASGNSNAGGDNLAQRDALLIQDYSEVLAEVDRVLLEMDIPPLQVAIEAKILSVKLNDALQFGVNFAQINKELNNSLLNVGSGGTLNGTTGFPGRNGATLLPAAGQFLANTAGLKYGFISGDVGLFINALENISDTNLVASPQLMVLNKQRAELIIGQRLSYKTLAFNGTQTAENVNFLDAGVKLRLRPFIAPDGFVRLEIHPERSTATINATTGLPNVDTTEVTSNVMVKDGNTLVIGGLIEEQTVEQFDRVPFLGALPLVGAAFRSRTESIVRTELIVLLTPRIIEQEAAAREGANIRFDAERRAEYFRDHTSVLNRRNLSRHHYERALCYFQEGDLKRARKHIELCLQQTKNNSQALALRDQIDAAWSGGPTPWLAPDAAPIGAVDPTGQAPSPGEQALEGKPDLEIEPSGPAAPAPGTIPVPNDTKPPMPQPPATSQGGFVPGWFHPHGAARDIAGAPRVHGPPPSRLARSGSEAVAKAKTSEEKRQAVPARHNPPSRTPAIRQAAGRRTSKKP